MTIEMITPEMLMIFIMIWLVSIVLSTAICWAGLKHDRALTGFSLGFFLALLGVLIALLLRISWVLAETRDAQIELLKQLLIEKREIK